jgi:hypothetical protein
MSAHHLHDQLHLLHAERAAATLEGIDAALYLDDLSAEIEAMQRAFVGAAVTEIASFRAQLSGAQYG